MALALPCSPAAERNKAPILDVLRGLLPRCGTVLEIASGTGQHVAHFAAQLPDLRWQPSDPEPQSRAVITARRSAARLSNLLEPLALDVLLEPWPLADPVDAIVCINMIHIAPEAATAALLAGASRWLAPRAGGLLYLYGPFKTAGQHSASSNAEFDADLRARNPAWGIRDLDEVTRAAAAYGFARDAVVAMPANNLSVAFTRTAPQPRRR